MGGKLSAKNFLVKIVNNQHSTWQGTVTWVEKNEIQNFRSALELIKLIDSTLESEREEERVGFSEE